MDIKLWPIADHQLKVAYWHLAMYAKIQYSPQTIEIKRGHLKSALASATVAEHEMRLITGYKGRLAKRKPIDKAVIILTNFRGRSLS